MMNVTAADVATVPLIGTVDLGVFGAMLCASAFIGVYFGCFSGREQNEHEYLMGGKTMSIGPVAFSLVATCISGITVLGVPSEIYRYGTQFWVIIITGGIVSPLVAAFLFMPVYTELQINSCYEYLELRFDKRVRRFISFMFVIAQLLTTPIVIYVPAIAFSQVTGINIHHITPITCIVCIFYTTLGGLRAVVWSDTLQTILMFAAIIAVLIIGVFQMGGWSNVWSRNDEGQRLQFFNLDPDPLQRHTFWTVLIGSFFLEIGRSVSNQSIVQRILSVPDLKSAQCALVWFGVGFGASNIISILTGLLVYVYYEGCDPLITQRVKRPDQLLPLLVLETTGHLPGLSGLFLAGVFSAALSSMSSNLNTLSGVLVNDLFSGCLPKVISKGAWLRVAAIVTGAICVVLVFAVERLGGVLQMTLSFHGITVGCMLGVFTMGMFFPRANSKGVLAGAIASLLTVGSFVFAVQSSIANGSLKHRTLSMSVHSCLHNVTLPDIISNQESPDVFPLLRLSYLYYSVIGTALVLIVGLPVSVWFGDGEVCSPQLLSPLVRPRINTPLSPAEVQPLNKASYDLKINHN